MPRQKSLQPGYRFHISGQARVTLNGRDYLLGKHGSPESWAKYYSLLGEYLSNGFELVADDDKPSGTVERLAEQSIQIRHVIADYRARVLPQHEHNDGSYYRHKNLLELLATKHGTDVPEDFGPRKLEALRDGFVEKGNSRRYANDLTKIVIAIIEHGVSRELVKPEVIVGLRSTIEARPST